MTDRSIEDFDVEKQQKVVRLNLNPNLPVSKSLLEIASRSPTAAISSIAALFITIILSIVIPLMFTPCKNES